MVSMQMRRLTHLQERDQVMLLWGRNLVFFWHLRASSGGSGSGCLNHTTHNGPWRLLVVSRDVAEKAKSRLRYCLRFAVRLITGHCPLNKHLHNMDLIDEPICIACGMEDESAFHLLSDCSSLISLRMLTFSKPILGVEEHEGASASALLRFALANGRFTVTPGFVIC
jgi:hypothetical protein